MGTLVHDAGKYSGLAEFLRDQGQFDRVERRAISTVLAGYIAAGVAVLNQQLLPLEHALAGLLSAAADLR
jgi:hypothetical protein